MNPCVFTIFSLLFLIPVTATASQLVAVEENGVTKLCLEKERDALLHFKAQVLQDPYDTLSNWRVDDDACCEWSGVTCNDQTRVIELNIRNYDLVGEVGHSLGNLTYLYNLDLSHNSFHGAIPRSIGSLTELSYLDLSYNSFFGTIPPEFGNLTNLQSLKLRDIGRCRVEKVEWLSHLSHLETLYMDGISLAKSNHWVDAILSLQNLSDLSLSGCELSQVMYPYSSSFLNSSSSSSIQLLYLDNNSLTSSMYRWLLPLTSNNLIVLNLSSNMLDGIPKYLGNLCSLERLYFNNNSGVVIKLPDFLKNVSGCTLLSLQYLHASGSQFTGPLSDDIHKFSTLQWLDFSDNQLNGSITQKLWQLPLLRQIDLSFNNITVPSTYHISSLSSVFNIDLSSCKLGPRFPKWILTLKNLTDLDLSSTGISDTVPLEFWDTWPSQLTYLNLSSNNIIGKLPDLLSNFRENSMIDLSSNNFYGPIPIVPAYLYFLNLSRNKFSGGTSFICHIVDGSLLFLDLSHNSLTGQLPDCLQQFIQLTVLNLGHNNLFGSLPPSVGSMTYLKVLNLYNNNFSGELPLSLENCTSLISMNLGANKFSGNVPVWIGEKLSGLYVLILRSNSLVGTIPLKLCLLANLQILDLSINNLHGNIPSCFSNLTGMIQQGFSQDVWFGINGRGYTYASGTYVDHAMIKWQGDERELFSTLKYLKSIDLSSNNLTGQFPHEITNLSDLIAVDLSNNALYGEIPQKIGEMKRLLTLDLSRNNFSGQIPSSMSQMSLLNYLDLSSNNLSGRIPSSTQLQSFDPSRYDGNARLCGPPLAKKCPGDEEPKVPPVIGKSEGDGEDTDEVWGWFYIGGGMGFTTGFWIACGALLLNRRWRHAFFNFFYSFKDWVYGKVVVFIANFKRLD